MVFNCFSQSRAACELALLQQQYEQPIVQFHAFLDLMLFFGNNHIYYCCFSIDRSRLLTSFPAQSRHSYLLLILTGITSDWNTLRMFLLWFVNNHIYFHESLYIFL